MRLRPGNPLTASQNRALFSLDNLVFRPFLLSLCQHLGSLDLLDDDDPVSSAGERFSVPAIVRLGKPTVGLLTLHILEPKLLVASVRIPLVQFVKLALSYCEQQLNNHDNNQSINQASKIVCRRLELSMRLLYVGILTILKKSTEP